MSTAKMEKAAPAVTPVMDWLRLALVAIALLGAAVAGYMAWAELANEETVCVDAGSIDCRAVQQSAYAETFGIPVALLGLLGFLGILIIVVLEDQIDLLAAYGRTLIVAMALFGVIFQTYLTYIEADVLKKWCQWCVTSYILVSLVLLIGSIRLYRFLKPLQK